MYCTPEEKKTFRKEMRKTLRSISPEERKASDDAVTKNLLSLPEYEKAERVFAFIGIDWEIDTKEMIRHALEAGKQVAVPICTGPGIMEARIITGFDQLHLGAYDIPEPNEECPVVEPEWIQFAVIPCVTMDVNRYRLGQGGGFYDRFMEKTGFFTAAICRDQVLCEAVPREPWDQQADCVVTETKIIR